MIVRVPESMALDIEDRSGSISIINVRGDISIDDGSGGIVVRNAGALNIKESGSGSVHTEGIGNRTMQ